MRHTSSRRARRPDPLARLRKIADLAESDPSRFREECRQVASKLGVGVEQLYRLESDPEFRKALKEMAVNAALSGAVKLARRALGI
jgi:hypothetical protein